MSKGQKPVLSFRRLMGRVAGFLLGAGVTVLAVLAITGDLTVTNGAGEPTADITRILVGLLYCAIGLTTMGAAIAGFPEGPHSSSDRTDRESGFDGDGGDIDVD
ncbi:hypothetical protein DMH01_41130 [Amycolatopsis sp. WAC 04182]|uniref:hypothetical protein n=1 Tax=Amycolatopsis sp. WAC 04182 TaxID=2203198 RepID=UPI000F766687|nr:hypothetical protein [Amycolatopsis sp. WAC 04182]RSN52582.1 hypothetical protein DMH01_41130 [Amycolatopsis sp. WAC 04182]